MFVLYLTGIFHPLQRNQNTQSWSKSVRFVYSMLFKVNIRNYVLYFFLSFLNFQHCANYNGLSISLELSRDREICSRYWKLDLEKNCWSVKNIQGTKTSVWERKIPNKETPMFIVYYTKQLLDVGIDVLILLYTYVKNTLPNTKLFSRLWKPRVWNNTRIWDFRVSERGCLIFGSEWVRAQPILWRQR